MSDQEDTKQCTNCKLEILCSNYTIHSAHCQRNFYLCSQCEQPVNYKNKTEHDKTYHVVVHCTKCQLELQKYLLDDHLVNGCPARKVKCQICDIETEATDIAEHENYCWSRTEKCMECGEFVMIKYKSLHLDSNHAFIKLSDEPGPSPSWQYGRRTLCNFMPDLSSKTCKSASVRRRKSSEHLRRTKNLESSVPRYDSGETSKKNFEHSLSEGKDDQVSSNKYNIFSVKDVQKTTMKDIDDEWPPLCSLRSLQISEEKGHSPVGPKESYSEQNKFDEDSDLKYAIQVSQEINADILKKGVNKQDEVLKNCFKPLVQNELPTEKFAAKNMFEKNPEKLNEKSKADIFENYFHYLYERQETVKLPCEFCGVLIVSNDLFLHQRRCRTFLTETYSGKSERHKTFYVEDDMEKKIACGICNKFFRLSALENHQLQCKRNPTKALKNQDKINYSKNLKTMNMKSEQGLQNGLESSSPQLTRVGTRSEWFTELSKSNKEERDLQNYLNQPESGVVKRPLKVSKKNRRAPSPPRR